MFQVCFLCRQNGAFLSKNVFSCCMYGVCPGVEKMAVGPGLAKYPIRQVWRCVWL